MYKCKKCGQSMYDFQRTDHNYLCTGSNSSNDLVDDAIILGAGLVLGSLFDSSDDSSSSSDSSSSDSSSSFDGFDGGDFGGGGSSSDW